MNYIAMGKHQLNSFIVQLTAKHKVVALVHKGFNRFAFDEVNAADLDQPCIYPDDPAAQKILHAAIRDAHRI